MFAVPVRLVERLDGLLEFLRLGLGALGLLLGLEAHLEVTLDLLEHFLVRLAADNDRVACVLQVLRQFLLVRGQSLVLELDLHSSPPPCVPVAGASLLRPATPWRLSAPPVPGHPGDHTPTT